MRIFLCLMLVLSFFVVLGGCSMPLSPVAAPLVLEQRGPVAGFDSDVSSTKVGRAWAEGIVFVGYGDASILTAARRAGITRIHHVDSESTNIFGIYCRYVTVVYGE